MILTLLKCVSIYQILNMKMVIDFLLQVYRSEWILDTASPDWKPVTLDCAKLCLGDWNRDLRYFQFVCILQLFFTFTFNLLNMNIVTLNCLGDWNRDLRFLASYTFNVAGVKHEVIKGNQTKVFRKFICFGTVRLP